jgi:Fe-coproporphyrin III synthase
MNIVFDYLFFSITNQCNLKCLMCNYWCNTTPINITHKDICNFFKIFAYRKINSVAVSGGEPLLNEDIWPIICFLKNKSIKTSLITNGYLLSDNICDISKNTDTLFISIDGDEDTHDKIRGVKGSFRKICDGIDLLKRKRSHCNIYGIITISKLNYLKISEIIILTKKIGFKAVVINSIGINPTYAYDSININPCISDNSFMYFDLHDIKVLEMIFIYMYTNNKNDFESSYIRNGLSGLISIINRLYMCCGVLRKSEIKNNLMCSSRALVIDYEGKCRACFYSHEYGNISNISNDFFLNYENHHKEIMRNKIHSNTCSRCMCFF